MEDIIYPKHKHMLETIQKLSNPKLSEVSDEMKIDKGNATRISKKLERFGYITRKYRDGRSYKLKLTKKGEKAIELIKFKGSVKA